MTTGLAELLYNKHFVFVLQLFNMNEGQEIRRCDVRWRFFTKNRIHHRLVTWRGPWESRLYPRYYSHHPRTPLS